MHDAKRPSTRLSHWFCSCASLNVSLALDSFTYAHTAELTCAELATVAQRMQRPFTLLHALLSPHGMLSSAGHCCGVIWSARW